MTKSEVIAAMAEGAGITKKQAEQALDILVESAYAGAREGFTLPGLGKLVIVDRKERMARNPASGQMMKIPAKKAVKFRVAKACKDAILGVKKK